MAEIAKAQRICPKRVEAEIEKAASIEDLIEVLVNISANKPESRVSTGLRLGDENITIPLKDESQLILVLEQIVAVNTHKELITIFAKDVIFKIGLSSEGDINQVSPEVFKNLTQYFLS